MFLIRKPTASVIEAFLTRQRASTFSYPEIGATAGQLPTSYTIDENRIVIGSGLECFRAAITRLRGWQMFQVGWAEVFPSHAPIRVGETVAVLFRHFGIWSLNACRIVYVFDEERSFGFAYGTLQDHAECGEERFSVEWSAEDDKVFYRILAFSKPKQWQARVARPLARMLQKRFVRESKSAMTTF